MPSTCACPARRCRSRRPRPSSARACEDDRNETVEDYRGLIEEGVALRLPFVCANPDLVVDVGDRAARLCAGSHRRRVRAAGRRGVLGRQAASRRLPRRRCSALASCAAARPISSRILAIGDAVRTDLAAAQGLGVDGLFIAAGIHSDVLRADGEIDPEKLAALFGPPGTPPAVAAMTHLRW